MGDDGPLTTTVLAYVNEIERLVPTARTPDDWEPLRRFFAEDEFERVGTFKEVQDFRQYLDMLSQWASSSGGFETTLRRMSELPGLVYYEVEERHRHGDSVAAVNSMSVFAFTDDGKIRHLDVYLQQQPH